MRAVAFSAVAVDAEFCVLLSVDVGNFDASAGVAYEDAAYVVDVCCCCRCWGQSVCTVL